MENRDTQGTVEAPKSGLKVRFSVEYMGFSLLFAWHYCLWFVPETFPHLDILDDSITYAWLVCLGVTSLVFFILAGALARERHLSAHRSLLHLVAPITAVCSLVFVLGAGRLPDAVTVFVLPTAFSISSALFWMLWGEHFARVRATFDILDLGPSIALPLIGALLVCSFLPAYVSSVFMALLPVASGILLTRCRHSGKDRNGYPIPQPREARARGLRNMVTVSIISFIASITCYYLLAIVPAADMPGSQSFLLCALAGGCAILGIYLMCRLSEGRINIFRILPWLLIVIIISYALILSGNHEAYMYSFIFVGGVYTVFELLLLMYFAVLMLRGYVSAPTAFGFSGGFVRAGTLVGNLIAYSLGGHAAGVNGSTASVAVIMLCAVAILLIPLVRQEYRLVELMSTPSIESDIDKVLGSISSEFKLSGRESEILGLLAKGYAADTIAKRLVISTYTVQTHVQHIYTKMGIHKRSELLEYISIQSIAPDRSKRIS